MGMWYMHRIISFLIKHINQINNITKK